MRTQERPIRIIGTGVANPATKLTHQELDQKLGITPGLSQRVTGITSRFVTTTETAADLAAEAARMAVANAELRWKDIDCLIGTSATIDQALPYNAATIHAALGLTDERTTFDIGASCLSFLTGLDIASYLTTAGRFKNILLVGSDISTFTVDMKNLRENGIFGDGAAACIIRKSDPNESSTILHSESTTLSEGVDFCQIRLGTRFHHRGIETPGVFEMNPRPLFALTAKKLPAFVSNLLEKAGTSLEEIDLIVPHQASHLALDHAIKLLKIDPKKVVNIFAEHGNQVGASLPTALHYGLKSARRGDKILLLGSGAGVTLGGMVIQY